MAIQVERVQGLPAIIVTQLTALVSDADVQATKDACFDLYEALGGQRIYLIHDIRNAEINFAQLVLLLPAMQRHPHRLTDLPLMVYDVLETDNSVLMVGLKAVRSGKYGKMEVALVHTVEEALGEIYQAAAFNRAG
jgi:hypothetical protein